MPAQCGLVVLGNLVIWGRLLWVGGDNENRLAAVVLGGLCSEVSEANETNETKQAAHQPLVAKCDVICLFINNLISIKIYKYIIYHF